MCCANIRTVQIEWGRTLEDDDVAHRDLGLKIKRAAEAVGEGMGHLVRDFVEDDINGRSVVVATIRLMASATMENRRRENLSEFFGHVDFWASTDSMLAGGGEAKPVSPADCSKRV